MLRLTLLIQWLDLRIQPSTYSMVRRLVVSPQRSLKCVLTHKENTILLYGPITYSRLVAVSNALLRIGSFRVVKTEESFLFKLPRSRYAATFVQVNTNQRVEVSTFNMQIKEWFVLVTDTLKAKCIAFQCML